MTIQFNIQPRMTGKTATCVKLLRMKNQGDNKAVMFVHCCEEARNVIDEYKLNKDWVISQNNAERLRGRRVDTLILDEWMFFKPENMENIILMSFPVKEIIIYTTFDKLYDLKKIEWVKEGFEKGFITKDDELYKSMQKDIRKLSASQFFNPETNIINMTRSFSKEPINKMYLTEEDWKIEYLGHYIKE